jgi:hypothetical protein
VCYENLFDIRSYPPYPRISSEESCEGYDDMDVTEIESHKAVSVLLAFEQSYVTIILSSLFSDFMYLYCL